MNSQPALIRLLRTEVPFHDARPRCLYTLSAGQSVAQILQSEFGPFHADLRKPFTEQMPENLATKPMEFSGLEVKHEHAHLQAVEFELGPDNPHKLEGHGAEVQPGQANPHARRLEAKNGHTNLQLHGLDSKQAHTRCNRFGGAEQEGLCTKSSEDVIKLLIDRVNSQSWIALEKDVQTFRIEITPKEVAWVLKVLKNPSRAWELFKAASCWPGYVHDSTCYSLMVDLLGKSSDHSLLNDLLAEMEKQKIHFSLATINKLIGIYATSDEIHKAEHYFLKLNQLALQPTAYTYKCMLQAFAKAGKCEKALEIYGLMQKEQQPITVISYNMLMDALSKNGKNQH